jgi:NAD(P)-dependent dehydrogenase (short-subunit alcohol dehydrogenase family)
MDRRRTILVTGASSGIGAYCARALQEKGWRVFATARNAEDVAALEADGIEAFAFDYSDARSIAELADAVLARTGGRLDALYNNGAYAQAGAVEDLPTEALRRQFEANFFGWHELTRRFIPAMREQGHGRIVNCSSILGLVPMKYRGAYAASKYALEGLTLCLRMELEGSGIHVSLIEPGSVDTGIAKNGLSWFERYIDIERSAHREAYRAEIERLKCGKKARLGVKPDAVLRVLLHALENPRPKPHYLVTVPARIGAIMKHVLPAAILYRILASRARHR